MGLLRRGLAYRLLKMVESYQYRQADIIGVQTPGNLSYFAGQPVRSRLEVLQNWISPASLVPCSIQLRETALAGKRIFVYAGNMGVAQGAQIFLQLAARLRDQDVGFVFVGRGSETRRLRKDAERQALDKVLFFEEIPSEEIPGLYTQCDIGLVALDPRHRTHNVPGKFLTYMQSGLPVLASINPGNDLVQLIEHYRVGRASFDGNVDTVLDNALALLKELESADEMRDRCRRLAAKLFSSKAAATQVVSALEAFEYRPRRAPVSGGGAYGSVKQILDSAPVRNKDSSS